jgi:EAL domain-containing protein (putative c-di-GMP-specific phosphodiesterase class I)
MSVYQKIVFIRTGETYGYEALLRAQIDGHFISTAKLFRQAQAEGKVTEVDKRALELSIQNYPHEEKLFLNCTPKTLSTKSLQFPEDVELSNIVLEITENAKFEISIEQVVRFLEPFRDRGLEIAIDDYGVGWSNLQRIAVLKPEYLKLDQSVIRNVHENQNTQDVVAGMVNLCTRVGIQMIAEGVETEKQATTLRMLGVQLAQGFYYGMPIPGLENVATVPSLE